MIGCYSSVVTPVPIPNTEVKHTCADGTAWETVWESRSQPIILLPFFYFTLQILKYFPCDCFNVIRNPYSKKMYGWYVELN